MGDTPKVSIITPVYNCENYLEECFGSILSQTLKEIEIIAVNDGSADNSLNLLKQIADKDSRVRIIDQENKGGGIARNAAIKQAQGEYIGFVDADDWIDANYYECLYLNAKKSDADIARTLFLCHYPDKVEEKQFSLQVREWYNKGELLGKNDHVGTVLDAIYKKELIQGNGIYFDVTPCGHDRIFSVKAMFFAKKVIPVVGTYYHHRHHSSDQLHVFNTRRLRSDLRANKHIVDFINRVDYIETGDYLLCAMKVFWESNWYFNLAVNDQNINKKDIRKFFAGMKYVYKHCKYKDDLFQTYQDQFLHVLRKLSFRHYYAFCKNQEVMTLRIFLGKARRKILRMLFGRNLYANVEQINQQEALIREQINRINILENRLAEQSNFIKEQRGRIDQFAKLSWYRAQKYAPESKYPEILSDWYYERTGRRLDLNNPLTFNEKIQWLKLYDSTPLKTCLTDKFLVRDWIKEKIGEEYLIPLLGVYDSFDEIDFDSLPNQFVLKTNHGSAMNIIVTDKIKLDRECAKRNLVDWMQANFAYKFGLQLHYRDIEPKIIIEQYLEEPPIIDYRFYCFDGHSVQIWVDVYSGTRDHLREIYDIDWNKLPLKCTWPSANGLLDRKPENFERMKSLAEILSHGFSFVRVDFYSVKDKIYFGEMTFTPMSGTGKFEPKEWDLKLGDMLKLPIDMENNNE